MATHRECPRRKSIGSRAQVHSPSWRIGSRREIEVKALPLMGQRAIYERSFGQSVQQRWIQARRRAPYLHQMAQDLLHLGGIGDSSQHPRWFAPRPSSVKAASAGRLLSRKGVPQWIPFPLCAEDPFLWRRERHTSRRPSHRIFSAPARHSDVSRWHLSRCRVELHHHGGMEDSVEVFGTDGIIKVARSFGRPLQRLLAQGIWLRGREGRFHAWLDPARGRREHQLRVS